MFHICRLTMGAVRSGDGRFHISRNCVDADPEDPSCWVGKVPDRKAIVSACPTTDERLDTGTTPVIEPKRQGAPNRTSPPPGDFITCRFLAVRFFKAGELQK